MRVAKPARWCLGIRWWRMDRPDGDYHVWAVRVPRWRRLGAHLPDTTPD